jgi:hypothetical protein
MPSMPLTPPSDAGGPTPARTSPARRAAGAVALLALASCAVWALAVQSGRAARPSLPPPSAPASAHACCTVSGPYNAGRVQDAGPESAPVQVIGYQGTCWEHKVAGDMLVRLADEYTGLLRVHLRPLDSDEGRQAGLACTAYLLRARGYHPPGAELSEGGYDILVQKSPAKGRWTVLQLEEAVRSAIAACGGKPSRDRIAPTLPAEPPPGAGFSGP